MCTDTSGSVLVGQKLSSFYVEKHEYPSGSKVISELPIRVWVIASEEEDAVKISVGPAGCSIRIENGKPESLDMAEYGKTLILPQFLDENLRAKSILSTSTKPCKDGEKLTLRLSDASELTFTCYGDDELRPSIDQSQVSE